MSRLRVCFFAVVVAAVTAVCSWPLKAAPPSTRPTTVPAGWEPRYWGYVSNADLMARVLRISDEQRQRIRDRLLLMSYEMEQWEEREGTKARQLDRVFNETDRRVDPKGHMVAFFAWEAAIAPKDAIRDEHLRWVDEVLTAEQRAEWHSRELYLDIFIWLNANGLVTDAQGPQVRQLAKEVSEEIPGDFRDPRVNEARRRRLVERLRTELLGPDQAIGLAALMKLREDAKKEYEATARTQPATTRD